jgi:hypothetical protein
LSTVIQFGRWKEDHGILSLARRLIEGCAISFQRKVDPLSLDIDEKQPLFSPWTATPSGENRRNWLARHQKTMEHQQRMPRQCAPAPDITDRRRLQTVLAPLALDEF